MSVEDQIAAELDEMLLEMVKAQSVEREARRAHDNARSAVNEYETRAQKLRLALFRLAGEKGEYGDANVANNKRRAELLKGAPPNHANGSE